MTQLTDARYNSAAIPLTYLHGSNWSAIYHLKQSIALAVLVSFAEMSRDNVACEEIVPAPESLGGAK